MNKNCIKCGIENLPTANYCCKCGFNLAATMTQNRTVINENPIGNNQFTDQQIKTRIDEVSKYFDNEMSFGGDFSGLTTHSNQREATYLAIDVSGSMANTYQGSTNKLQAAIQAATTLVLEKARIDANDEIGVIFFNHNAKCILPHYPISTHKMQIINAIQSLKVNGGTDQAKGLECAENSFDWTRNNVVRRIEFLTDGHGGNPVPVANTLKSRGIIIDVIGIGEHPDDVNVNELRQVASNIQGQTRYRFIKDSQTLNKTFTQLAGKTYTC